MVTQRPRARSLPPLSARKFMIPVTLRAHRLMTTRQIWELCYPHTKPPPSAPDEVPPYIRGILTELERSGWIQWVPSRLRGQVRAWFLTEKGWEATTGLAGARRFRQEVGKARGVSQLHTLGVNDVGLMFVREARKRGDLIGPPEHLAWEHEVPHEIGYRQTNYGRQVTAPEIITSDAVLRYETTDPARIYRFLIELDRCSITIQRVREKIEGYHAAFRHRGLVDPADRWAGSFPAVLWIFEDASHRNHAATEQLNAVVRSCWRESIYLRDLFTVEGSETRPAVYLTTKELLAERGPSAIIWRLLSDPTEPRSLLHSAST